MLLQIAVLLVVAWLLGILVIKATSAAIHVLLFVAAVVIVAHVMRRRARPLK
jgi:hypothetical protein